MDEENNKRTNIEDLPTAETELTDEEAKNVQGGLTKTGLGTLAFGGNLRSTPTNTIGGATSIDPSDPSTKVGDGSV